MTEFHTHTIESAPEASRPTLEGAKKAYGAVPNLLGVMAEAPALLEAYVTVGKIFDKSSFTPTERQVVLITVSALNQCEYCVAAHSVIASMQEVSRDVVDAIREGRPIADPKLEVLRAFAAAVVTHRGFVTDDQVQAFLAAGYGRAQVLEVILGVGMKTLSNYTNHIAGTELDSAFSGRAWKAPKAA